MPQNNQVVKIKELLERGVENIYPNREFLEKLLNSDKKLTLYQGFDPTADSLHIGNAVGLLKLRQFQELGHKVIFLIGDYTAMIGDPDKKTARKPLTHSEVMANCKNFQKQAAHLLDFESKNKVEIKYNSAWLSKLSFAGTLDLLQNFTVQRMLERDLFENRIKDGNPLYLHEFMYPVMQAYDSVAMDVDGEIGGNDQTFNMLSGRDLMRQLKNKEKFVLTTKLLTDPTGKKMGKTEGNMVRLDDTPKDMFGKVMSWPDTMIALGFELCTLVSMERIAEIKKSLAEAKINPRDLKVELAKEIIKIYYSENEATVAATEFDKIFRNHDTPDIMEKLLILDIEYNILDLMTLSESVTSKSEGKRLVEQGGVKLGDEVITDWNKKLKPADGTVLKVGKRKFVEIKIRGKA